MIFSERYDVIYAVILLMEGSDRFVKKKKQSLYLFSEQCYQAILARLT